MSLYRRWRGGNKAAHVARQGYGVYGSGLNPRRGVETSAFLLVPPCPILSEFGFLVCKRRLIGERTERERGVIATAFAITA